MIKDDFLQGLEMLQTDLINLKKQIQKNDGSRVWTGEIIDDSKRIAIRWFDDFEPVLSHFGVSDLEIKDYHARFDSILRLAARSGPSKKAFLEGLEEIIANFADNLVVEVQKFSQPLSTTLPISYINAILNHVTDEEKDYLLEALDCVRVGARRASVIMGWCAAVYRMHKIIESLGFEEFNNKSKEMKNKTKGRYGRFKKEFAIDSLFELRATVFDTDLLWVLEYWGLIDSNQHNQLSACYVMRSTSAHPGEAEMSDENLISFFSDLRKIIFTNPKFQ